MMHKVTCMDCGETARIQVEKGKKIESDWWYFGKMNVNACQTDKFFWKSKTGKIMEDLEKVMNPCYDPKVKPKYVELWECPKHHKSISGKERLET